MSFYPNYGPYVHTVYNTQQYIHGDGYNFPVNQATDWRRHHMMHHGTRATESKPRLAKEEVDKLEAEFRRNHKPNSILKKKLAEEMRVDIARINNWFQNRRAKAKQEKRAQENEALRKSEQAASEATAQDAVKEYYSEGDHHDDLRPSAAPFPSVKVSASPNEDEDDDNDSLSTVPVSASNQTDSESVSPAAPSLHLKQEHNFDDFAPTDILLYTSQSPCDYSTMDSGACAPAPVSLSLTIPSQMTTSLHTPASAEAYSSFQSLTSSEEFDALSSLPSQFASDLSAGSHELDTENDQNDPFSRFNHMSPDSVNSPLSSGSGLVFKSSPPIDIASRRNTKRPAQLGTGCMRSYSYNHPGMKTGMEMPRRLDAPSPMRRVASATGTMPRGIQKSIGMGPRSPLYFDRNQELLLQIASQTPIPPGPCSSIAPPTPNTPIILSQQSCGAPTLDDDKGYTFQTVQAGLMSAPFNADPTMRTPPDTPGLMGGYPSGVFSNSHLQATFDYNVIDEPLITPGLGSFDNDFPTVPTNLPTYVSQSCSSQPTTPSYPTTTMGPAFFPPFVMGGNQEYNWSDASARSSPGQLNRAREFQFTNMTAQDFHGE